MKAVIYNPQRVDENFLEYTEITEPSLNNNNAIIKMSAVGVCGSDLLKLDRDLVKPSTVLGHELVGTIYKISAEMSEKYNLKEGQRIISSHHVPCLHCKFCLNEQESLCQEFKQSNFFPGAFCEYIELSERHLQYTLQKIPDSLSDAEASFTEPLACCIKAIERSNIKNHQGNAAKVLVLGLGSIGLMLGQLVKHYRPELELFGCDLLADRLNLALELGFDQTQKTLNDKFDFIFLCAGANISPELAIKHADNGANIIVFSSIGSNEIGFNNNDIYYKELTIKSSYSPNLKNLEESLRLIKENKIQVKQLISHQTNLSQLGKTITKAKQENALKVLLVNN